MVSYSHPDSGLKSASYVRDWLKALLRGGPMKHPKVEEYGAEEGITPKQLKGAREKLMKEGIMDIRKEPDHWVWFLVGGKGDPKVEKLDTTPPQGNGRPHE